MKSRSFRLALLVFLTALLPAIAIADVVLRSNGSVVGPVTSIDGAVDGGLYFTRATGSSVGTLRCASVTGLTRGCVDLTDQTMGAGNKTFQGTVAAPRVQAAVVDAGIGMFTGVLSAPVFDGGAAVLTGDMGSKTAHVFSTTDNTALSVAGVGTSTGAETILASATDKLALTIGYYGSPNSCCTTHVCGCTAGGVADNFHVLGSGDVVSAGSVTLSAGNLTASSGMVTAAGFTSGASGIAAVGPIHTVSTLGVGAITLSGGTGTATVFSGAKCVCSEQTTAANGVKCSVSGTTLTATGTNTDVITYLCL